MSSKYVTEKRKDTDDKWSADELFDDFDICMDHLKSRVADGWTMRLFVPGSFSLNQAQLAELRKLRVEHNQ